MPNYASKVMEEQILNFIKKYSAYGFARISYELKGRGENVFSYGVYNVHKRRSLNKLPGFKKEKKIVRYEKEKLFEMTHIDVKYAGKYKESGKSISVYCNR